MKQRLNPVLPPPRRLLNPVDALLTARSPAQVRLHFARYKRALLYEWERDPKYQGAKGSKWIGTGDDAGKTPRYQASKPGSGRGKKEPAATGGRGGKDEAAGKGTGGKPSQKEPHADIVQHLRDVLSGEGEEADALFAKLQDRLQGMSPAERKEAAEKLGAVLGGKKPAAKREPKKPASKATENLEPAAFDAMKAAYAKLDKESTVKIPELLDEVKKAVPGITQEQFGKMLMQWRDDDLITLQVVGHRDAEPRSSEGVDGPKGMYFYVIANEDPARLKLPPGRDKPTPAAKPAPAKRTPAAKKQGPKEGDVNAKGQVFKAGRWRKPGGAEKPKEKAPAEKKQPAAKPGKIADKPTPGKPSGASPQEMGKAIKDVVRVLKGFPEYRDGLIDMGGFYAELQDRIPDLTVEQFHNLMWQLGKEYKVELHVLNETKTADNFAKKHAIQDGERMYNFIRVKGDTDPTPSKPVDAKKQFKTRSEYEAELNPPAV